jgi:hypothetical protein
MRKPVPLLVEAMSSVTSPPAGSPAGARCAGLHAQQRHELRARRARFDVLGDGERVGTRERAHHVALDPRNGHFTRPARGVFHHQW